MGTLNHDDEYHAIQRNHFYGNIAMLNEDTTIDK